MPEKAKEPRIKTVDPDSINLPDVSLPHMIEMLQSVGFVSAGFNGAQQVTWQEIRAWQEATEADVTPWEVETLYRLSGVYAAMLHKAKDPGCPSPSANAPDHDQRKAVNDFFKNLPTKKVKRRG